MDEKVETTQTETNEKRSPLYETTRRIMLAAIGAAAIATEELDSFLTRLSERGELAERDARRLADEMKARREEMIHERRAERVGSKRTATKDDVDALNARIAELTQQLDELKRSQS